MQCGPSKDEVLNVYSIELSKVANKPCCTRYALEYKLDLLASPFSFNAFYHQTKLVL